MFEHTNRRIDAAFAQMSEDFKSQMLALATHRKETSRVLEELRVKIDESLLKQEELLTSHFESTEKNLRQIVGTLREDVQDQIDNLDERLTRLENRAA